MGHTYSVCIVPEKNWTDDDVAGYCVHHQHKILIRDISSKESQQQVFCHELIHAILHRMGEDDLDKNEKFVDVMGSLLHQAWITIK